MTNTEDGYISFDEFFSSLADMHFFYEDKRKRILPFRNEIGKTWEILLHNQQDISHNTILFSGPKIVSICTSWRTSWNCWCLQNGIASNIQDYIRSIVQESARMVKDISAQYIRSWSRPDNRIVNKMCGQGTPLYEREGLSTETLMCLEWDTQVSGGKGNCLVVPASTIDKSQLKQFLLQNKPSLFYESEDIEGDLSFDSLNLLYDKSGLSRSRDIEVICSCSEIIATVIAYHSSPGINFSFLENRTEVISRKDVDITPALVNTIFNIVSAQSKRRTVPGPVVTDCRTGEALLHNGARLIREYSRRIWTKQAYAELLDYINKRY